MALSKWGCSWEYHYLSCGLTFGWNTPGACPDPHQPLAPSHSPEKGHQAASMQGDRSRGLQANFQKFMSPLYIYIKKKKPKQMCTCLYFAPSTTLCPEHGPNHGCGEDPRQRAKNGRGEPGPGAW